MSHLSFETKKRLKKELDNIFLELQDGEIIVEGKKDKIALNKIGLIKVNTLQGDYKRIVEKLKEKNVQKVFILTDFDRRGDELAEKLKGELTAQAIDFDLEKRKRLGAILNIKFWEEADTKLEQFLEKIDAI
ncbi:MAG: toprim domain-containing protein [Candidatus Micrarchaeia archaeon]|jgi:5S rRNA maturation endonuclease (ribonuclease M5)